MSLGVPDAAAWLVSLLLFAGLAVGAGEGVRVVLARWLAWFRGDDPLERILTDLYLAGAVLYLLAVLPLGLFRPPVLVGTFVLAIVVGVAGSHRRHGNGVLITRAVSRLREVGRPAYLTAGVAALVLLCLEVLAAGGVPTGNTFDSSVDATFTALLTAHGNVALTLQPVGSDLIAYPQGSTAWFGGAQLLVGWSAVSVPLMLTPLFMALAPLGGFALGRRWLGSERAGALFAVGMAVVVPGTRFVAYGSNDFVLAFPLVLLLAARTSEWSGPTAPAVRDALAFGLFTGYSAAINPVGAEWLLTVLAIFGSLRLAEHRPDRWRWGRAWLVAAAVAVAGVVPSLIAIGQGAGSPGGPTVGPGGVTGAQFVGWTDPFLFGAGHPLFSPDEFLQLELAALLVVGATLLVLQATSRSPRHGPFRAWVAVALAAAFVWELLALAGGAGQAWASSVSSVSSGGEMGLLLFTLYGLVALYPLYWVLDGGAAEGLALFPEPSPARRRRSQLRAVPPSTAIAVALLVLVPGAVATVALLPTENHSVYGDFSRVTAGEFALLGFAGNWLHPGARVLVAPGSAAEFLPAYNPTVTILFPMVGASWRANATYVQLCGLLVNGTFGPASDNAGLRDLAELGVQYLLVTGNDTTLFPAFDDAAMRASGDFTVVYGTAAGALFAYDAPMHYAAAPD